MRILLIGGSGFIGPHIARALTRDRHEVIVFHRGTHPIAVPGVSEVIGDRQRLTAHADALRALAPDVVVDVVLSSGRQARELMSLFRGAAGRVVALSSGDVYRACGITHGLEEGPLQALPLTESSELRSKLQTYPPAQIQMLSQVFGWIDEEYDKIPVEKEILGDAALPGTVLRLPMVYGRGDPLHRFQPIVKRILDGRRVILFSADMAGWRATKGYVEDVGEAVARAATSDRAAGRIFNVGEGDALTELEWAQAIARAMGWDGRFLVVPNDRAPAHLRAPGNTAQHWVTDTARIRRELGFVETASREDAVIRTVEWEKRNPPAGFTPHQFDYAAEDAAIAAAPAGPAAAKPSAEQIVGTFLERVGRGVIGDVSAMLTAAPRLVNAVGPHPFWGGRPQALHLAVEGGRRDIFDLLLERGADVNGTNDQYDLWSPLTLAIDRGRADMRDTLLERGARVGLLEALMLGDDTRVDGLLSSGRLPDIAPNRGSILAFARTPFAIDRLLALGASTEVADRWGSTPIDALSRLGPKALPLVRHLAARGVPAAPKEFARLGDQETLARLAEADPEVARLDSVMMGAVDAGHHALVAWLLAHGASANARSDAQSRHTALHSAAWNGDLEMTRQLVEAGADVSARDDQYHGTPAGWAETSIEVSNNPKCADVVVYLKEAANR